VRSINYTVWVTTYYITRLLAKPDGQHAAHRH